ncbi:MAG: Gfo/Idh/MocA family oxidoreductase [Candidatus Sumerlaeota bacterium]|nr:Gfo/Idh/MocA family oxidoreductase [Candidatus Sumerlaeota bacterium]
MNSKQSTQLSRRKFISAASAAAATAAAAVVTGFPQIVPSSVFGADGQVAPSNRITFGNIGVGGEGTKNLNAFLSQPDARILAVCDMDLSRCDTAQTRVNVKYKNSDCAATKDFRELIARKDLDAICISTPDHWHTPISLMAIRAGKDVICEKPTLTVAEGRILSDTVKRYGAVFQTSTEDRSLRVYHRMAELVRNGRIGKLHTIRVGLPSGKQAMIKPKPDEPIPAGFDYEMWLGPAQWAPYSAARCHWNFRWIFDYSGGMLTDWGAHLIDTAQWGNDTDRTGPVEVEGKGEFPKEGLYNTAAEFHLEYTYANGVKMIVDSGGVAQRFEGSDGWVGNKGWIGPVEASSKQIMDSQIGPEEIHLYTCPGGEHRNFLDCVKSRREPYFPAEIGHRCASVMHIGNISMLLGRKLKWDPVAEKFLNDEEANRMLTRFMREPWTL